MVRSWRRWAAALLVIIFAVCAAGPMRAADRSGEIAALQKQLEQIRQQLSQLDSTVENAEAKKAALEQQSAVLFQQITLMLGNIEDIKTAVAAKQQEVDAKTREIEDTDALFQQRLRAMQLTHVSGALSTLLSVNSFDELLTASTTLSRISQADTELLQRLAEQKTALETQKQELDAQLQELIAQQQALEAKQSELAASILAQDAAIDQAEADKQAKQSEYDATYAAYRAAVDETNAWMSTHYSTDTPYTGSGTLLCPIQEGYFYISSGFGTRSDPFGGGQMEFHNGYDYAGGSGALMGRPIHAAEGGIVTKVEYRTTGYGLKVVIDHGGGLTTLYGHCSKIYVSEGQSVARGEVIAAVGDSGNSTAAHLHFSVFQNGVAQDPGAYLG
ncbi:peptidoglycan DD-metalloendopeptidase family protein [Anaerofilum sp. BX8]|uniref:Peptidoglycan DD-metalloendopeptidase family protein n=1 Tax=Anaerofilum hominis TaxID=2763016 RepID=A0A923L2A4_9FIRM|nr:peptidoglycan DD-metalloendopeptidase family protein [Anaerofilum hominis]MBC5582554.1 peptidoglycan DD-metalloendopeptidase family protein [Anaerofilum hominis]